MTASSPIRLIDGRTARDHGRRLTDCLTMTNPAKLLIVAALATAAAGCQSSSAPTVASAPPATDVASPSPTPVAVAVKMPKVTGERLDVAESDLDAVGLSYTELGGGTFGIIVKSNWYVCSTRPAAGVRTRGPVRLVVARQGGC